MAAWDARRGRSGRCGSPRARRGGRRSLGQGFAADAGAQTSADDSDQSRSPSRGQRDGGAAATPPELREMGVQASEARARRCTGPAAWLTCVLVLLVVLHPFLNYPYTTPIIFHAHEWTAGDHAQPRDGGRQRRSRSLDACAWPSAQPGEGRTRSLQRGRGRSGARRREATAA